MSLRLKEWLNVSWFHKGRRFLQKATQKKKATITRLDIYIYIYIQYATNSLMCVWYKRNMINPCMGEEMHLCDVLVHWIPFYHSLFSFLSSHHNLIKLIMPKDKLAYRYFVWTLTKGITWVTSYDLLFPKMHSTWKDGYIVAFIFLRIKLK